jgi:hypothetical protein
VGVVEMNWCERERRFNEGVSRRVEAVRGVWRGVEDAIRVYILLRKVIDAVSEEVKNK